MYSTQAACVGRGSWFDTAKAGVDMGDVATIRAFA